MTKLPAETQADFCSTIVDEWVRAGVRSAVISPGSRSAPMALALVADGRIEVMVRLDERSAGFLALGIGVGSGFPAVVLTTSGTAAAEIHPAVVEADLARVPLIACTADRPPELHDVGAPQTIEQRRLYGGSVRWFLDAGVPEEEQRSTWRSIGSRIFAEAVAGPAGPGPVHVNLAFREPLLPPAGSSRDLPAGRDSGPGGFPPGRDGPPARDSGRPWHGVTPARRVPARRQLDDLGALIARGRSGVIVAGAGCGEPEDVEALAAFLGWPLLADPRSGCRRAGTGAGPPAGTGAGTPAGTGAGARAEAVVVAAADAILRNEAFRASHRPEVVLRLGEPWASKVLAGWLADTAAGGTVHVVTDPHWAWRDPGREAAVHIPCDPDELVRALLAAPTTGPGVPEDGGRPPHSVNEWARSWRAAEEAAQQALEHVLYAGDELTEPFIARHVSSSAGVATIFVASSMPVRDVEWFGRPATRPPRVLSNRGANGIDGVASTTLGVAAAGRTGGTDPGVTIGLLGDLAFLHDLTAFVHPAGGAALPPCIFVVVDNHGGGIFSFLPQAAELEVARFERLFGTPQKPDVAGVARGLGARVTEAETRSGFEAAFVKALEQTSSTGAGGETEPVIVVARTNRHRNVDIHAELNAAVSAALDAQTGAAGA